MWVQILRVDMCCCVLHPSCMFPCHDPLPVVLTKYLKRRVHSTVNLLTGESTINTTEANVCALYISNSPNRSLLHDSNLVLLLPSVPTSVSCSPSLSQTDKDAPIEVISYWHPNLTLNLVADQTPWTQGTVPPPLDQCEHQDAFPSSVI